jgi:hypothetical protein
MSVKYIGGVISATPPTFNTTVASGVWTLDQVNQAVKASSWPTGVVPFISLFSVAYSIGSMLSSTGNLYTISQQTGTTATLLTKQSPTGTVVWQTALNISSTPGARSVFVDSSENIYISALYPTTSTCDLIKYNSAGTLQWQKNIVNATTGSAWPSCVDSSGNIYWTFTKSSANNSIITMKLSSTPTITWQKYVGGASGFDSSKGIAIDLLGNIVVVGVANPSGTSGGYAMLYDNSGTLTWQKHILDGANEFTSGVLSCTWYQSSAIYITGQRNTAPSNSYLCKLDSNGAVLWARTCNQGTNIVFSSSSCDTAGNVYTIGVFSNTAYIVKFDSSGTVQWQRSIVDNGGGSYAGNSNATIYVDPSYINVSIPNSATTALVMRLPIDGSKTGSYTVGAISVTYAASSLTIASPSTVATSAGSLAAGTPTETIATSTIAAGTVTNTVTVTNI